MRNKDILVSRETFSEIEDDNSLVTLFRENTNLDETSLKEIENIQDIIISFTNQKSIFNINH